MPARPRRPRDPLQLAKLIGDGDGTDATGPGAGRRGKNPAAVSLGRLGGLKGGNARAKALTAKRRKAIASKAGKARWSDRKKRGR
jgi:hypothetical protein